MLPPRSQTLVCSEQARFCPRSVAPGLTRPLPDAPRSPVPTLATLALSRRPAPTWAFPTRRGGLESANLGTLDFDDASSDVWLVVRNTDSPSPAAASASPPRHSSARPPAPSPAGEILVGSGETPVGAPSGSNGSSPQKSAATPETSASDLSMTVLKIVTPWSREDEDVAIAPAPAPVPVPIEAAAPASEDSSDSPVSSASSSAFTSSSSSPDSESPSATTLRRVGPSMLVLVPTSNLSEPEANSNVPMHDYDNDPPANAKSLSESPGLNLYDGRRLLWRA